MMKLEGVGVLYKNLDRVRSWGYSPRVRTPSPKNVAFGYDVGKISACCLVYSVDPMIRDDDHDDDKRLK